MAQSKTLAWRELRVGILVVASFVLLAVAIFFIGGENGFFTPRYNIIVTFDPANGLHAGAVVLLDGVTIGNVSSVKLSPSAVEATLRLDKRYHDMIHDDAEVTISTLGLLGDLQVELTRGSSSRPLVADGQNIKGAETKDIKKIISGTDDLVGNFKILSDQITDLATKLNKGEGTLGKLLNDNTLHDKFSATATELNNMVIDAHRGNGSLGRLISDDQLYRRATSSVDRLDSSMNKVEMILDQINRGQGTAGRLITDPALFNKADKLLTTFGNVADRIDRGEGTLGKLSKDDTLVTKMNTTLDRVDKLVTSVENGQGTLGMLVKDPTMYNSFTQTSSEIQKLLYDFRQNPKKYLTINFRLF